ncbi:hypothetical protein BU23DRAFT_575424 [Bimuria novae-zelandiae CBS 107.79]|uniref:Uncharacterized protein n=1 Tax=Bimuria novae-zelandiae CBS 107.79 TaxID=1447943 RepID=A0A6A5UPC7_9PLEO|nr:hypothetical protein BU23DRAFT_575424 [Bimuria novae-zelandiae CBS 107.79]
MAGALQFKSRLPFWVRSKFSAPREVLREAIHKDITIPKVLRTSTLLKHVMKRGIEYRTSENHPFHPGFHSGEQPGVAVGPKVGTSGCILNPPVTYASLRLSKRVKDGEFDDMRQTSELELEVRRAEQKEAARKEIDKEGARVRPVTHATGLNGRALLQNMANRTQRIV